MPLITRTESQGNLHTADADPGAVGAGHLWADTNTDFLYRRNDANDGWIRVSLASDILTLTNKTLTSPVLTTPQLNDTSADHQYITAVSELVLEP